MPATWGPTRSPAWRLLAEQFASTVVVVLLVAAVVAAVLGDLKDTVVILAILVLNGLLGFVQEYRAERPTLCRVIWCCSARAVAVAGAHYRASGIGYDQSGALLAGERPLTPRERAEVQDLFRAAVLCNDAHLERHDGRWRCVGDPTEGRCSPWRPRAA